MIVHNFTDLVRVIAHEAGHGVTAWASPLITGPVAIRFFPVTGEAECEVVPLPEPTSTEECLEYASLYLGGVAGEAAALGDFGCLAGNDLQLALHAAVWVRRVTGVPRRRPPRTPFLSKLHRSVGRELRGFLNEAYDLAVRRIALHADAHARLRDLLAVGYGKGQVEWDAEALAECLGPPP